MTTLSTNTTVAAHLGSDNPGFFAKIWGVLMAIAEANPELKKMEYLSSLSDAQLAQKGLKREDIARHVFRNKIYL